MSLGARQPVRVENLKELKRSLKGADKEVKSAMRKGNKEAAQIVAAQAKIEAPVRTGRLAAAIKAAAGLGDASVRAGGAKVPYAGPIHFGWMTRPNRSRGWRGGPIHPQPFLFKAMSKKYGDVLKRYEELLDKFSNDFGQ